MKCNVIRGNKFKHSFPDFASLHPGYMENILLIKPEDALSLLKFEVPQQALCVPL